MLSVIIITKNEAQQIEACLQSVSFADEWIVLDSGSTDNTVDIARKWGAQVFELDWPGYGIQKQRALEKASGDWILSLDADERMAASSADIILAAIKDVHFDAFRLSRQMIFDQKILKRSAYETKHIRLFRRDKAKFSENIVHESVLMAKDARIGSLSAVIEHVSYDDLTDALAKMNHYASLSAQMRASQVVPSMRQACMASLWMFFRNYVLKAWFLDGQQGLLWAIYYAEHTWYRYIKQIYPDKPLC